MGKPAPGPATEATPEQRAHAANGVTPSARHPLLLWALGKGAEQAGRKHGDLTMVHQGREMQAEAKRLLRSDRNTGHSHLKPVND